MTATTILVLVALSTGKRAYSWRNPTVVLQEAEGAILASVMRVSVVPKVGSIKGTWKRGRAAVGTGIMALSLRNVPLPPEPDPLAPEPDPLPPEPDPLPPEPDPLPPEP